MTQQEALNLKRRYASKLLAREGVCGLGITQEEDSDEYLLSVLLSAPETAELRQQIAEDLDGHPFKIVVTGPLRLFRTC